MSATRPPMLAADYIRELVRPYTTNEIVTQNDTTRVHTVHHDSLLDQLRGATHGSTSLSNSDASRGHATSKPAAHLEALDALARIDHESKRLADDIGAGTHPRLEDRLLAISGILGTDLNDRVRSWWTTARLVTHHDTPAMRPHGVPCLNCWELDGIRIRPEDEQGGCIKCGAVWDRTGLPGHGSLLTLADHVKWCTDHDISKARHWETDPDGYPVECTTCLVFREEYALIRHAAKEGLDKTTSHAS